MEQHSQVMQESNQGNSNNNSQQTYHVPLIPRKTVDRLDLLSALGDVTAISGAAISFFANAAGPTMNLVGTGITQLSNYLINKAKRAENARLANEFERLKTRNPNISVNLPITEKSDEFGLQVDTLSSTSIILTLLTAGTSSSLAIAYNVLKATTNQDYQAILLAAIVTGFAEPIAEKILQHYKLDNLNRQNKVYQKALGFFSTASQPQQENTQRNSITLSNSN